MSAPIVIFGVGVFLLFFENKLKKFFDIKNIFVYLQSKTITIKTNNYEQSNFCNTRQSRKIFY